MVDARRIASRSIVHAPHDLSTDDPRPMEQPLADSYRPIGDYAVIGDSRCAALVSRAGSIAWLWLPNFSGSAVFAALLDSERGGRFVVPPTDSFTAERS